MNTLDIAAVPRSGDPSGTAQLEQTAAPLAATPDPAMIARMANAFFSAHPANPVTSPGAALPSAPLFSAEPLYSSIPGVPAATPPLTPNHNPGSSVLPFPTAGAAAPSAPIYAADPQRASATPGSVSLPSGGPLSLSVPAAISSPVASPAAPGAPPVNPAIPHQLDYAALPGRLDTTFAFVPSFESSLNPYGGPGLPRGLGGIPAPAKASYYFLTDNPAAAAPGNTA
jgi:cysteine desulfurase/selenocysteine lyase